jgi:hypothetical protein
MSNPSDALLERVRRALPERTPESAPDRTPKATSFEGRPEVVDRARAVSSMEGRPAPRDANRPTSSEETVSRTGMPMGPPKADEAKARADAATMRQAMVDADDRRQDTRETSQRAADAYRSGNEEASEPPPPKRTSA